MRVIGSKKFVPCKRQPGAAEHCGHSNSEFKVLKRLKADLIFMNKGLRVHSRPYQSRGIVVPSMTGQLPDRKIHSRRPQDRGQKRKVERRGVIDPQHCYCFGIIAEEEGA